MRQKFKFATVVWMDAFSWEDSEFASKEFKPSFVISTGHLISDNKTEIVISRDRYPSPVPLVRGTISIPRGMVMDVVYSEVKLDIE